MTKPQEKNFCRGPPNLLKTAFSVCIRKYTGLSGTGTIQRRSFYAAKDVYPLGRDGPGHGPAQRWLRRQYCPHRHRQQPAHLCRRPAGIPHRLSYRREQLREAPRHRTGRGLQCLLGRDGANRER